MMRSSLALALVLSASTVLADVGPAHRQVIPAAANAAGVGGTSWQTELVLHNPATAAATVTLRLIAPASTTLDEDTVVIAEPLAPGATAVIEDVVGRHFGSGLVGALEVSAADATGGAVAIVATSRTATTIDPTGGATFGQGIPAVPWPADGSLDEPRRWLTDLEISDDFRTNLGFVNLSPTAEIKLALRVLASDGQAFPGYPVVNLPANSFLQSGSLLDTVGATGSALTVEVELVEWTPADAPRPDFLVYASKVDNHTGDPTYLETSEEVVAWGPARHRFLPAAASAAGSEGSHWTTDLTVHYPGDLRPLFLQLDLIPSTDAGDLPAATVNLPIQPHQTVAVSDVVGSSYPDHEIGGLLLRGWNGGARYVDLKATSRTWTPAGDGLGTYGQGIPTVPRGHGDTPLVVAGLEESDDFRTNLGLVNASTNLRQTLAVAVYAADGTEVGSFEEVLEPWSHLQVNRVLERVAASGGGFTAVVRLTGSDNLYLEPSDPWEPIFMAYGSRVDRRSNDPTYLNAVPLAEVGPPPTWFDFTADAPWYRCPEDDPAEEATVVRAFDRAYHWFGAENHRSIVTEVDFPDPGEWEQIGLRLHLECPESGLCDHWDRTASLQLVLNPEEPEEDWQTLEIARYITPYRIEMCEYIDVTRLAPLLTGRRTLVSWIDTWVGPGHSSGEGWRISHDFVFYPGPSAAPAEVVNVWGLRSVTIGDLGNPVEAQLDPVTVDIPADATRVEARLLATGHSFQNTANCAEFCVLRQDVHVNDVIRSEHTWRTDCEYNPHSPQSGTWLYDRNGWCPGAVTVGNLLDLTDLAVPGQPLTLDFDIRDQDGEVYVNTNPGQYAPFEWLSMQVFVYRD